MLLSSEHFFDEADNDNQDEIVGAIVKSPLQLINEAITFFEIPIPDPTANPQEYYTKFFKRFVHDSFC